MATAHRNSDSRFCGATTVVSGQSSVFVNGLLWAVEGDENTHGNGDLIAVVGSTVKINGKKVIVAVGDTASPDNATHTPSQVDPQGHSDNVSAYG
jgi:uncharacterized Zn-binding protein involved in type VI secretion